MRRRSCYAMLVTVTALAAFPGCGFWFGDDDDCDHGGDDYGAPLPDYRDPDSGECVYPYGGGGGGGCNDPAPEPGEDDAPEYDYAVCYERCEGLSEATCLTTAACRAIYVSTCPPGADCEAPITFAYHDCWGTAPSGPLQGGDCTSLDAHACSQHDDCAARHLAPGSGLQAPAIGPFEACIPEAPPPGECASIADAATCAAAGCQPVYCGDTCPDWVGPDGFAYCSVPADQA